MSEAKHTPGPWNRTYVYYMLRHIDKHVDLSELLWEDEQSKNLNIPGRKDADLITAAPKLLAALESMVAAFDGDIVPPHNLPDGVTPMAVMFARDDALKAAHSAIVEAKGQQS